MRRTSNPIVRFLRDGHVIIQDRQGCWLAGEQITLERDEWFYNALKHGEKAGLFSWTCEGGMCELRLDSPGGLSEKQKAYLERLRNR